MQKKTFIKFLILAAIPILLTSWGFLSHKSLQQVSIYTLPAELGLFFYANQDYLVTHSIRPDVRRRDDKSEDPKHYLDMDADVFGPNYRTSIPHDFSAAIKKYSLDSLKNEGIVPWEVNRVYKRLVYSFQHKMKDSVLFYAADLGHYVADSHVPLHTTKNHDGQYTNQKGIHVLWESLVPEEFLRNYQFNQVPTVTYIKNPQDFIFDILLESHDMLPEVYKTELALRAEMGEAKAFMEVERGGRKLQYYTKDFIKAYGNRLGTTIEKRMLLASHRVASFWYSAWKDAGSPAWVTEVPEISATLKQKYANEKSVWSSNNLIKENLLISLKTKSAE